MREQRRKIWIDRFQTHLAMRIALYFILYQVAVWAIVIIEHNIFLALQELLGAAAAYSLILLGIPVLIMGALFIYDAIKVSHRVVGPLYRFRKTIQAVTAGEPLDLITLRHGDFLQELRADFNEMLTALAQRGAVTLKTMPMRSEHPQGKPTEAIVPGQTAQTSCSAATACADPPLGN